VRLKPTIIKLLEWLKWI